MSNARPKKRSRFNLSENKGEMEQKVDSVINALQLVQNGTTQSSKLQPEASELAFQEISVRNSVPNPNADEPQTAITGGIQTSPRVREQLPIAGTFSQKAGVIYIQRFDALVEKRRSVKTPPFIKRDLLEEALEYIFEKYGG